MNKNLFLVFNHQFTTAQEADAFRSLGVEKVVYPPDEIVRLWGSIPPELPEIREFLEPVRNWLAASADPGDYVLVQGDFGACFILVSFAIDRGFIPVYSTTRREATEELEPGGTIRLTHHFDHQIFRRYGV